VQSAKAGPVHTPHPEMQGRHYISATTGYKPAAQLGMHTPLVKVAFVGFEHAVQTVGLEHVEHPKGQGTQTLP